MARSVAGANGNSVASATIRTPGHKKYIRGDQVRAMRYAADKLGKLRLLGLARHAEVRESALPVGLRDLPVELSVEGVVDSVQVVQRLCASDVLLFVRDFFAPWQRHWTWPAAAVVLVGNIFRGPPLSGISQRYYVDSDAHTGPVIQAISKSNPDHRLMQRTLTRGVLLQTYAVPPK